jgi:DNA invertase Pin-like site-specific DNA recombinase
VRHETSPRNDAIGERAAQYVRMSTDEQDYSTLNQAEAIAAYALAHNLTVIRTYTDEGRSGLLFDSRPGLKQLISDVQNGQANFSAVLVYDVSRWGRFQDVDEGAYYEQLCKRAGVRVIYCAEDFENDGSVVSTLLKALGRAEAAKYSRRLSIKVFAGQCNLVRRGFWQGASPGYGLRRALIDANGSPKAILVHGERKFIQSDRVILVPGPTQEVEIVRRVFDAFVSERKSAVEIAADLNSDGVTNGYGRPWSRTSVRKMLASEKYVGTNLFNRCSVKLKGKIVRNAPEKWIRVENAFEAIVEPSTFAAARDIEANNQSGITNEELLSGLAALLKDKGRLTCRMINEAPRLPHSTFYRLRFGSLIRLFERLGYQRGNAHKYCEIKRALAEKFAAIVANIVAELEKAGLNPVFDKPKTFTLDNRRFSIFIVRYVHTAAKSRVWLIQSRKGFRSEQIVAVRMDQANFRPLDYLLLPTNRLHPHRISLGRKDANLLDGYRFRSVDALVRSISELVASTGHLDPGHKH